MSYNITRRMSGDFDAVVARVKDALKTEGFGVLTETRISGLIGFSAPAIRTSRSGR